MNFWLFLIILFSVIAGSVLTLALAWVWLVINWSKNN